MYVHPSSSSHPPTHIPTTATAQVDYWLPDPEIKPTKFKISVLRPDNQGQLKPLKKVKRRIGVCAYTMCV